MGRARRFQAILAVAALALAATATAAGAAAPPAPPPRPSGSGIEELGAQLGTVARRHRLDLPVSSRLRESARRCAVETPPGPVLALVEGEIGPWLQAHRRSDAPVRALRVIDVAVHVITDGGAGSLATASIDRQLALLDAAFAAAGISFRRVAMTRTSNAAWFVMTPGSIAEREAKVALGWDSRFFLNLYTGELGGRVPGWATFPWDRLANPTLDGVVVRHSSLPRRGDADRRGDTAVHEVAHWLGLHSTSGSCMNSFTPTQVSRISAMLATYRQSL